jgi:hypothetical protein
MLTPVLAEQLKVQVSEHARYFYWLRRRMIEWGLSSDDETLALVARIDELLSELKMHLSCEGVWQR